MFSAGFFGDSIGLRGDGFMEIEERNLKIMTILFSTEDLHSMIFVKGNDIATLKLEGL